MNTKIEQQRKNQQQETRQELRPQKQAQKSGMLHDSEKHHDQEHPETRLTR